MQILFTKELMASTLKNAKKYINNVTEYIKQVDSLYNFVCR